MLSLRKPKTPVFILGCQRSGTTICQNVFLNSRQFDVFREGNRRAMTDNFRLRDDAVISKLIAGSRRPVQVFKPINDSQWADRFLSAYERARIIWIWRDVHDTANSAVAKWGRLHLDLVEWIGGAYADFADRDRALVRVRERVDYDIYAERLADDAIAMLAAWSRAGLTPHAGAAALWWLRNRLYFDLELVSDPRVLLVKYEDFVSRPQASIQRLCEFMEASYSPELAEGVHTGSVRKNSPPELPPIVAEPCAGLAARFEAVYQAQLARTARVAAGAGQ